MVRLQAPWFCKKLPNYPKVLPKKWIGNLRLSRSKHCFFVVEMNLFLQKVGFLEILF